MKLPFYLKRKNTDTFLLVIAGLVLIAIASLNAVTNQSISFLQTSNRNSSDAYILKDKMQKLFADVLLMESVQRSAELNESKDLQAVDQVQTDLRELQPLVYEQITKEYDQLAFFVNRKIKFNTLIVDAYKRGGKPQADAMMNTGVGDQIRDSIYKYASRLEIEFSRSVQQNLEANYKKSSNLKPFISILSILSFIAIVGLSVRVIYRIDQKNKLIRKLRIAHRKQVRAKNELKIAKREAESIAVLKQNFLANMSHEIRTPINAVIGFSNILNKTRLSKEQKKFIQLIQASGASLLALVNDILDLSKLEAGMVKIDTISFDPRNLCSGVFAMFEQQAKEKGIHLEIFIDEECPSQVAGDPMRLNQILMNLVNNALKFTTHGSVRIAVKVNERTKDNCHLLFIVQDTGIGMTKEQADRIFNRFDQAEQDIARRFGGTGLGLAIVKNLVELQGGTIQVESVPGRGSVFQFLLPVSTKVQAIDTPKTIEDNPVLQKDIRLLVVDDNEINLMLLEYLLSDWGLYFEKAQNGMEAIEKVKLTKFDLIFMDIQMPVMDGYKTTEHIRKTLGINIPIIAMTAHVMPEEKEKCRLQGMNDYISKPLQEDALKAIIAKYAGSVSTKNCNGKQSIIDARMLNQKFSGNTSFISRIVQKSVVQYRQELQQLQEHRMNKDHNSMEELAHKMRSTVSVLSHHSDLVNWLTELEYKAAALGCWNEIDNILKDIFDSEAVLRQEVGDLLAELDPGFVLQY